MPTRFTILAVLCACSLARAEIESPLVKKGLAAHADLDYGRAVELLEQARKESLTREEKIATYGTLGVAYVALGRLDEARASFERLLRVDPSHQPDRSVAPKVRAVFEEAKAQAATSGKALGGALPQVTPELAPATVKEGEAVTVRVAYPGGVAQKMALYHRTAGQRAYSRLTVEGVAGRFQATIPGLAVRPPGLEYHLALLDEAGAAVAAAGTLGQPSQLQVEARKQPVYKKGWFWGVLGGVAAAGALAATLAVVLPRPATAPVGITAQ